MRNKKWAFNLEIVPTLAMLTGFFLLLYLGSWQLKRADEKQMLYEEYQQKEALEPINLNSATIAEKSSNELIWRKVVTTGKYEPAALYLLDNQVEQGVTGYNVYSPFSPLGAENRILINRGWVPGGQYREVVPEVFTPGEILTITGRVVPISQPFKLNDSIEEDLGPGIKRVQEIKLTQMQQDLGYNFVPYIIRLEPSTPTAFAGSGPSPGSGRERHLGYAFQWFALAFTLVIIFVSVSIKPAPDNDDQ